MKIWRGAMLLLMAALFLFLAIRANDSYRWSDWAFGDAQTMLTLRQWHEGGWINNYLLFKPQGYSPVVDLLDEPGLRQHAHGIFPGSSPRIGPRLWYTHYPPGYLIPFATFYGLGLDSLFALRLLSIGLSLAALGLMYLVFERITSARIGFLAALFYGLSPSFLGYADSLANQPIDDLCRFTFMYAVIMASRASDKPARQRWLVIAWLTEFALSLSSFDSVFFVYAWLIGWDFYEKRGFRWKRYLLFALAPLSAHWIQVFQNIWYLGYPDAITDLTDTFFAKHGENGVLSKIVHASVIVFGLFNLCFQRGGLLVPAALGVLYLGRRYTVKSADDLPSAQLLLILLGCGLLFPLILPNSGGMTYESRQFIPFICLVLSGASWMVILGIREATWANTGTQSSARHLWNNGFLALSGLLILTIWTNFALTKRTPTVNFPSLMFDISVAERLKEMPTPYQPVFLSYEGFRSFEDKYFVPGYPQISPLVEYYIGSRTVLCMDKPEALAQDLATLVHRTERPFSPVLVTTDLEGAKTVLSVLAELGVAKPTVLPDTQIDEIYAIDLTNFIEWENASRVRLTLPLGH